jgi:type I restriction enzyme, S subunit
MLKDNWRQCSLGEAITFQRGYDLPQAQRIRGSFPLISSCGIIDNHNQYCVAGPGVVTGRYGTVGEIFFVEENFWPLNTTLFVKDFKGNDPQFISFFLQRIDFKSYSGKSGVPGVNRNDLHKIEIKIPLPAEQRQIADILTDTDALIISLEKLIAKKRHIKQAAMQSLLTGKKRLPGFSGKWEHKTLLEVIDCLDNLRVPLNDSQRLNMQGGYAYCGANGILDYIDKYLIDDDIILIAEDGGYFDEYANRPIAYRMKGRCWVNNHAHILKAKKTFSQDYVFYSLVHKNILSFLASGTRAKLNKSEMYKIEVGVPKDKIEQIAIANIFNDMDSDIASLERKLDKYKQIKQGMMQELLTGKIRLV